MQVPLGIFLNNENKLDEMVTILEALHKYVPTKSSETAAAHPVTHENITVFSQKFHEILFGGDQLTVARVRGAQRIRANSETEQGKLLGLTPVCEDWHTKLCLMGVSYYLH